MEWPNCMRILMIVLPGRILALSGCAGTPVDKTLQIEELLGTAGFRIRVAGMKAKVRTLSAASPRNKSFKAWAKARRFMSWWMRRAAEAIIPNLFYAFVWVDNVIII